MAVVTSRILPNLTPIFIVADHASDPWSRPWGATRREEGWAYPAYYPFGAWAARDLLTFPGIVFDESAQERLRELDEAAKGVQAAEEALAAGRHTELPVPSGHRFYGPPPFFHQTYGAARIYHCFREWMLWEMGTGKTRAVIEGVRLLRRKGPGKLLVIAPTVVLPTWERQVREYTQDELKCLLWRGEAEDLAEMPERAKGADVVVATYARVRMAFEFDLAVEDLLKERPLVLEAKLAQLFLSDPAWAARVSAAVKQAQRIGHHVSDNPFTRLDYTELVLDESHVIGNFESGQTQAVLALTGRASRRILLTGTGADHPAKVYPQLMALAPGLMPLTWRQFQDRHMKRSVTKKYIVTGFMNLHELNEKVNSVASRMLKKDCLDLPELSVVAVALKMGRKQRARQNEIGEEMKATGEGLFRDSQPGKRRLPVLQDVEELGEPEPGNEVLMTMAHGAMRLIKVQQLISGFLVQGKNHAICDACQYMAGCVEAKIRPYTKKCAVVQKAPPIKIIRDVENPKLDACEALLDQIMEGDSTNKLIVWASFTPELDDLERAVKSRRIGYVRIDGKTSSNVGVLEKRFQEEEDCRVVIGQVSTGIGYALPAANYVIYYNLPWNPIHYRQSLDRPHRPGQTRRITVYRLMGKDTVEEHVAYVLTFKDGVAFTLLGKIACTSCSKQEQCRANRVLPFRPGCIYQPTLERPVVTLKTV